MINKQYKFIKNGLQFKNLYYAETFCIKYQLLLNTGIKHVNPLMVTYLDFSKKNTKFFKIEKFILCLMELTMLFTGLISNKNKLKLMFISTLNPNEMEFFQHFAINNGFYYSLGNWESGLLSNRVKHSNIIKNLETVDKISKFFVPEIPDLIVLFSNGNEGNRVISEARKCTIPIIAISSSNSDPRVTLNMPGDSNSPSVTYMYCKLFKGLINYNNNKNLNIQNPFQYYAVKNWYLFSKIQKSIIYSPINSKLNALNSKWKSIFLKKLDFVKISKDLTPKSGILLCKEKVNSRLK